MEKLYKIYETLDNTELEPECYPRYFVGAFEKKEQAEKVCMCIDIADCNSTEIEYGEISEDDIKDVLEFGLQGFDEKCLKIVGEMLKKFKSKIKITENEIIK